MLCAGKTCAIISVMDTELSCLYCKQPLTNGRMRRYCSQTCYHAAHPEQTTYLTCTHCQKPFTQPTRFYKFSPRQYCSKECYLASYCPVPDLTPSEPLAYLMGVCLGDGHANGYQYIAQIADRPFADRIIKALEQIGLRPTIREIPPRNKRSRIMWRVVASSRPLAQWMTGLTIENIVNILVDPEHKRAFLCGFYESEGSAKQYRHAMKMPHSKEDDPSRNQLYCTTRLTISNTDKSVLELVQKWAKERGHTLRLQLSRKATTKNKALYNLIAHRFHDITAFLADIQPCIKLLPHDAQPPTDKLFEINGEKRSIPEWAKHFNMPENRLKSRLRRGWPIERAIIP